MNVTIGKLREWWDLFLAAALCLNEAFLFKESSCPPCWKCTTIRTILGITILFGPWFISPVLGIIVWIGLIIYGMVYGDKVWELLREWLARKRT